MIKFDPITNRIYNDDRSIKIGYRESRVLELLLKHAPDIVSKVDIINYAWGSEFIGDTSLAKSISLLRQKCVKLGTKDSPIVTVPKVGYRLIDHCICSLKRPQAKSTVKRKYFPSIAKLRVIRTSHAIPSLPPWSQHQSCLHSINFTTRVSMKSNLLIV